MNVCSPLWVLFIIIGWVFLSFDDYILPAIRRDPLKAGRIERNTWCCYAKVYEGNIAPYSFRWILWCIYRIDTDASTYILFLSPCEHQNAVVELSCSQLPCGLSNLPACEYPLINRYNSRGINQRQEMLHSCILRWCAHGFQCMILAVRFEKNVINE